MNLLACFVGFSTFVLALLAIGGPGYFYADDLECWAKSKLGSERQWGA